MSSANTADEIKALKEKIAALEQENSSLKEWINSSAQTGADVFVTEGQETEIAERFITDDRLLKNFFMETLDGIVFWGKCGKIIAVNEATCNIFGLSHEEMVKHKISDFIYRKDEKYRQMKQIINERGALREEAFFLFAEWEKSA